MKRIIWTIALILLLSSCSGGDVQVKSQQAEDVFTRKTECSALKDKIKDEYINEQKNETIGNFQEVKESFYSKERNSCLFVLKTTYSSDSIISYQLELYDYFTSESIVEAIYSKDILGDFGVKEFERVLKEMKQEE